MNIKVSGLNVSILGRAIRTLANVGDEVYIELTKKSLVLRAFNGSRFDGNHVKYFALILSLPQVYTRNFSV